jgi:hypothetical protein
LLTEIIWDKEVARGLKILLYLSLLSKIQLEGGPIFYFKQVLDVNKLNTDNLNEKTYSLNHFFPFFFGRGNFTKILKMKMKKGIFYHNIPVF